MTHYHAEASDIINAPPEQVYAILADYHEGHPAILPARYFSGLTVTAGGQGEGTAVTVHMNVFGAKAVYNMVVSEPEPGRVLVEEDQAAGVVTTFALEPLNGAGQTRLTISTKARASSGLRGLIEKLANPAIMRKIYREELRQLAQVVEEQGLQEESLQEKAGQ
jgi:hypothetical protein